MKVNLSIVGMYFGIEVDLEEGDKISDLMRKASVASMGTDKEFYYLANSSGFLSNVTINHKTEAKSRNSSRTYPAGIYSYTDDAASNPTLVFQYYLFDKDMKRKDLDNKETPFEQNQTELEEGDKLIWRMVGIFTGPTSMAGVKG